MNQSTDDNKANNSLTAGYDGPVEKETKPVQEVWRVVKPNRFATTQIVAQVYLGERVMGLLYLDTEEEFIDLRRRIEGNV